jgi:hypothetical protein
LLWLDFSKGIWVQDFLPLHLALRFLINNTNNDSNKKYKTKKFSKCAIFHRDELIYHKMTKNFITWRFCTTTNIRQRNNFRILFLAKGTILFRPRWRPRFTCATIRPPTTSRRSKPTIDSFRLAEFKRRISLDCFPFWWGTISGKGHGQISTDNSPLPTVRKNLFGKEIEITNQ